MTLVQDYEDLQIGNFNFGKQQMSSPGPLGHQRGSDSYAGRSMTGASAGSLRHSPVSTVHIRQNTIQVDSINRITESNS